MVTIAEQARHDDDRLIGRAFELADQIHSHQMYGAAPYRKHIDEAYALATSAGLSLSARVAAVLHDTIEDTEEDPAALAVEIAREFGEEVFGYVWACTGEGANRAQRQASIRRKLAGNPSAIAVKLCDRILNIESCLSSNDIRRLKMYMSEVAAYDVVFSLAIEPLRERYQKAVEAGRAHLSAG